MEIFVFVIRVVLAAVFAIAGIGKLLDPTGSKKALKEFGLPEFLVRPVAFALPLAELAVALLFIFVETSWFGGISAAALLLLFTGGMTFQMIKGNAPDCHCFGQIHSEPVGLKTVLRNLVILLLPLLLIARGKENQGMSIFEFESGTPDNTGVMQILIALIIVALLAFIIFLLTRISDQQSKLMRRIDVLELLVQEDISLERHDIGHTDNGLPLGAPAIDFSLTDAAGKITELNQLLKRRKPLLLFFVGPNCDPCAALVPEIQTWANELGERFEFVFLSSGKPRENLDKFSLPGISDILLQQKREVAEQFGAVWTPAALLVNNDGTIGSRVATGDSAIRDLIAKIKAAGSGNLYITNGGGELRKSKIGESVPEFAIEGLDGKVVEGKDLRGKKTLVTFWSMHCPYCVKMTEDLRLWEKLKGMDEPNLVVFSDGEADDHKSLDLISPVLIDKDYKTAIKLGMSGTPSAVLVNEDGVIVSETAIGAPQIWSLIGRHK